MIIQFFPFFVAAALILSGGSALAGQMSGHEHTPAATTGAAPADVVKQKDCQQCGMDREVFAHSRMLITYSDGSTVGVCSIHCAATELKASKGKKVKAVEVADLNSKKLVNAEKATWVIGGSKNGVMTQVAKWAFAKKDDAALFIKKNGGKLATYKEALALAEKE